MKLFRVCALCLALVICFSTTSVFAMTDKSIKTLINNETLKMSEDYSDLASVYNNSTEKMQKIMSLERKPSVKDNNFYKVHYLISPDLVKFYKENSNKEISFKKNISQDYKWVTPVYNGEEAILLATYAKNNESKAWELAGFSDAITTDAFSFYADMNKIENILAENGIKNTDEIKFVNAGLYNSSLIYLRQGNEEYAIMLNNNSKALGVENGKLYKMTELYKALEKNYSPVNETSIKQGSGYGSDVQNTVKTISLIVMGLCITGFLAINSNKTIISKN